MPIIEGVAHMLQVPPAPMMMGPVREGRLFLDADGVVSQRRGSLAELHIGALNDMHAPHAAELEALFTGRGMKTIISARIRSVAWERYSFMASAVAVSVLTARPVRDAVRFAYGTSTFLGLLNEAARIGEAAGFAADPVRLWSYQKAFSLEGRPAQPPPMITDGGRAGDESALLVAEIVGIARRTGPQALRFGTAWERLTQPETAGKTVFAFDFE